MHYQIKSQRYVWSLISKFKIPSGKYNVKNCPEKCEYFGNFLYQVVKYAKVKAVKKYGIGSRVKNIDQCKKSPDQIQVHNLGIFFFNVKGSF